MPPSGRIVAIDYGRRRVGVAISDPSGSIAFPMKTIDRKATASSLEDTIVEIVRGAEASRLIVGLPLMESGEKGEMAKEVETFVSRLEALLDCPVSTWDERLSSVRAMRAVHEMGGKTGREKERIDRIAAVFILQGYLDAAQGGSAGSGPDPT
jgi:putative Holliday junction resolvase